MGWRLTLQVVASPRTAALQSPHGLEESLQFPAMIRQEELDLSSLEPVHPAETAVAGKSVLLAEDDPALRRYLEVVLERAGYKVVAAADGLEAMKSLLTNSVDVVVTDAIMPNLSGYELCRFVRGSQHLSHLPIILLTALNRRTATSELVDVNAYLSKPVSPEKLLDCLTELFEQAH